MLLGTDINAVYRKYGHRKDRVALCCEFGLFLFWSSFYEKVQPNSIILLEERDVYLEEITGKNKNKTPISVRSIEIQQKTCFQSF